MSKFNVGDEVKINILQDLPEPEVEYVVGVVTEVHETDLVEYSVSWSDGYVDPEGIHYFENELLLND